MTKTAFAARGKWRGILLQLGIDSKFLTGKHGPCPLCGGDDRFRWDNKEGAGTFICSQCGAGDGINFVMKFLNLSFGDAAREIDKICGKVQPEPVKQAMDEGKRKELLNAVWRDSFAVTPTDLVTAYLAARGVLPPVMPADLRFTPACKAPDGIRRPAMLALVRDVEGKPLTMHRTFLGDGCKAAMDEPRALMPGTLTDGACVRLSPVAKHIGLGEGIETALAAAGRFNIPTWATLNSAMLKRWIPPEGVERVTIFGDNDPKFGGQAATFALAHKLAVKGLAVDVEIPSLVGKDWADAA